MTAVALALAIILFVLGIVGTVLPVLPGVVLIYAGMLLYGVLTRFHVLDATFYIMQGMAVLLVFFVDYLASAVGTKRYGGSRYALIGAAVGTLLGLLLLGPFGVIIGPFLGAVVGEIIFGRQLSQAVRSGFGTIIGMLGGTVLKLGLEAVMIFWFFKSIQA